jgi:hypothetical protein
MDGGSGGGRKNSVTVQEKKLRVTKMKNIFFNG